MGRIGNTLSDQGRALPFALDLTDDAVTLYGREAADPNASWQKLGEARLGAPDFDEQIEVLRVETIVREPRRDPILLWLPPEQVISRVAILSADSKAPAAIAEAAAIVAAETDYDVKELCVAVSPGRRDEPVRVLGALTQTVHEAQSYAERWGFGASIVSTKDAQEAFGRDGPQFRGTPSYATRASHGLRRTAAAAVAALVIGASVFGAYQVVRPMVEAAPGLTMSEPEIASFAVVLDPIYGAMPPLKGVQTGAAESLALQAIYVPDDDRIRGFARSAYTAPTRGEGPAELVQPGEESAMQVGGAPITPERRRPNQLAAVSDTVAKPSTKPMRRALALIRDAGQERTDDPPLATVASDDAPDVQALDTPAATPPRGSLVALPDFSDSEDPDLASLDPSGPDEPEVQGEEEGSDQGSMAPVTVEQAPQPRPQALALAIVDTEIDPSPSLAAGALDGSDGETGAIPAPAKRSTDEADRAPLVPQPDAKPAQTPIQSGARAAPSPGTKPETPVGTGSEAEPEPDSVFAAASAPAPRSRPENKVPAQPRRPTKSVAGKVPQSLRSAEQTGLDLDATLLIGVIESRRGRQALVRTSTGDFRKVARGDVIDGWRVRSIDREAMRLTRSGKKRTLLLIGR